VRLALALTVCVAGPALAAPVAAPVAPPFDWSGRYLAEEAAPNMVMGYEIDVSRAPDGTWRALVSADGHMTMARQIARGVAAGDRLDLLLVRSRADHMQGASVAAKGDAIVTIERLRSGAFLLRFHGGGSYLNEEPRLDATRAPIPPWAGSYRIDGCAIDVALGESGWEARIELATEGGTRVVAGMGEEGEEVSLGPYLALRPEHGATTELLRLVRGRDGTTRVRFGTLAAPGGRQDVAAELARSP
jgi:hypothetical protein